MAYRNSATVMTVSSEAVSSHRLLCSVRTRLSKHFQPLTQHVKAMRKSKCHTLTSLLRNPYLLLAVVCCLSYWPSIWGQLVFDDRPAIIDNKDLRPHTPFYRLFQNDFWGTPLTHEQSHKSYRPLTILSFRLNFWMHALNPMGYHIINIALHSMVSILFYNYSLLLFCDSTTSLITALFFAVHSIHSDCVASIVGRAELLSAIFYLTTLLIWTTPKNKVKYKLLFSIISAWMGFLCKEQSLTVLLICAIYEIVARLSSNKENKVSSKANFNIIAKLANIKQFHIAWRKIVKNIFILLSAFLSALILRLYIMGNKLPKFNRLDNPSSYSESPTKQLTYSYLVAFNSWLLLFPCDLSCDWTHASIRLVSSIRDPRIWMTAAFFVTLIYLLYFALLRRKDEKLVLVLALAIVPFIPASNLFFPTGFVIAERVLYLPSMGFLLLIGLGVKKILNYWESHTPCIKTLIAIVLLVNAIKTYRRCSEWNNEYSLYSSGLRVNPENVKLLNNVGRLYERDGNYDRAITYYKQALNVEPSDARGHLNLGNVFVKLNKSEEAEKCYRKATYLMEESAKRTDQISPLHLTAMLRLADLLSKDPQRTKEAFRIHERILTLKSDYKPAYESWSKGITRSSNRHQEAAIILAKALEYEPSDPDVLYNLGIVICESGSPQDALQLFDKALSVDPHHEASLLASARIIQDQGLSRLHSVAIERLNRVIEMGRADENVYFNLAMLAIKSGNFDKGKELLERAIQIKSNFTEALYNMALLLYNENSPQPLLAVEYLTKLLKTNSDHIKGLLLLGDIYIEYFNDLKNGEICYNKILSVDSTNVFAQHNLCVIHVRRKHFYEAIQCFENIQRNHIGSVNVDRHLKITRDLLRNQLRNGSNEFKFLL